MTDTGSSGEVDELEAYEQIDEEEDASGDEAENEESPDENISSTNNASFIQVPTLSHELTNPILECLANIEIPYRCLYMSCGNFYSSKSQMLSHMRCDHGLEINFIPSVNHTIESQSLSPLLKHVKSFPTNSESSNRRHFEEEEEMTSHQPGGTGQVRGHVRHKCPYAQCFTCPHCFTCYSTAYRLTLHVKCSHRHVVEMQCAQQFTQQEQQRASMSSRVNAACIPLINLVKSSASETKSKMKPPTDKPSE